MRMIFEGRAMLRLKIREIAEQQGISCRQLARRSGLAESSVRRYWRDPGAHIRTDTLAILAHTLGVSPLALLDDVPSRDAETLQSVSVLDD